MDIKAVFDTSNTHIVGRYGTFFLNDVDDYDFCSSVILHIPDEQEPDLYKNAAGDTILSICIDGVEHQFMNSIPGGKIGKTIAPCVCGYNKYHYIKWSYAPGDSGYYPEYK